MTIPEKVVSPMKSVVSYLYQNSLDRIRNLSVWGTSRYVLGNNVFERDWDLLIILDSCRPDGLNKLKHEYSFIDNMETMWSVGGQSGEWMANTFDRQYEDQISSTAYVTANPHSKSVFENRLDDNWDSRPDPHIDRLSKFGSWNFVSKNEFGKFIPVWQYKNDGPYKFCPPRYVTDRVIEIKRDYDFDRVIAHYMPPHSPYVSRAIQEDRQLKEYEESPFQYLRRTTDKKTVFNAYLHMLRWALDEAEILLKNTDSKKVVITSDHGEAFGEYGVYQHHAGSLHPKIRKVPWCTTTATDTRSYEPQFDPEEVAERSVNETLEALGYI